MCGIFHLWIFGISSLREKEILSVKSEQIPQTAMKGERGTRQKESHCEAALARAPPYRGERHVGWAC